MKPTPDHRMPPRRRGQEAGIALFLALMVLVILMAIGMALVAVATTDLRVSGNLIRANQRFYAVDAAYAVMRKNVYDGMATWAVPAAYGVDVDASAAIEEGELLGTISQTPWFAVDQANILTLPTRTVGDTAAYSSSSAFPIVRDFTFGSIAVHGTLGHPSWDGFLMANPSTPINGLDGGQISFFGAKSDQVAPAGQSYHKIEAALTVKMGSNLLLFLDDAETTVGSRSYDSSNIDDPVTAVTNNGIVSNENDFEGLAADTDAARTLLVVQKPADPNDPPILVGLPGRSATNLTFKLNNDAMGVAIPYMLGGRPASPPGGRYFRPFPGAEQVYNPVDSQEVQIYVHKVTVDNPYSEDMATQPSIDIYIPTFQTVQVPWDDPTTPEVVEAWTTYSFIIPAVRMSAHATQGNQQYALQLRDRVSLVPRAQLVLLEQINTTLLATQGIVRDGGFRFADLIPAQLAGGNSLYRCHAGPPDCSLDDFWNLARFYAPDLSPMNPATCWLQVLTPDLEQYIPDDGSGNYPSYPYDWDQDGTTNGALDDQRLCSNSGDLSGYCAPPPS